MEPLIHPVWPADHARLLEVWESSVRATHHFLTEADIQLFKPLVQDAFRHEGLQLACTRDAQGRVTGFVGTVDDKVEMLFVDAAHRGTGLGRQLLRHATETLGAKALDVNEQNPQAVGFYERMGFEVVGRSDVDGMGKPFPLLHLELRC